MVKRRHDKQREAKEIRHIRVNVVTAEKEKWYSLKITQLPNNDLEWKESTYPLDRGRENMQDVVKVQLPERTERS